MTETRFADRAADWKPTGDPGPDHAFCVELLEHYLRAPPTERMALRVATQQNPALWHPVGDDALSTYLAYADTHSHPTESLRAALTACALTGGLGDWRDTIAWLTRLWHSAVSRGIDPAPRFEKIGTTADDENVHGVSGLSTRGLFRNAARLAESGWRGECRSEEPPANPTTPC